MAIKSILFNKDMVRAILHGRKTVTRRVIKPQPMGRICYCMAGYKHGTWSYPGDDTYKYWGDEWKLPEGLTGEERNRHWTPPCHTDDILYVRETWEYIEETNDDGFYIYAANRDDPENWRWRPSIHMPKEAARIFLRVTDVHVERLRDITIAGLQKEGIISDGYLSQYTVMTEEQKWFDKWEELWDSTIKKNDLPKYGWNANPWVWVIEFERCEKPLQFADADTAPFADQPVLMPAT